MLANSYHDVDPARTDQSSTTILHSQEPTQRSELQATKFGALTGNHQRKISRIALATLFALGLAACGGGGSGSGSSSGSDSDSSSDSGSDSDFGFGPDDSDGDDTADTSLSAVSFAFTPEDQTRGVRTQPLVEITSDVQLDGTSVNGDSVYLQGLNGPIASTVEYSHPTITLTPEQALPHASDFTVRVTDDVLKANGQSIGNAAYSSFRTLSQDAQPPALAQWEENMITYGKRWGDAISNESDYLRQLPMHYYDARRIHFQIADYTGNAEPWESYADVSAQVYNRYLTDNDFGTKGYMRFPHGLFMEWERNDDSTARSYLIQMRDKAAFSDPVTNTWADYWYEQRTSREVAYALQNQMLAERAGESRQTERVNLFVDMALTHVDIWTTGEFINDSSEWQFVSAFMTGLTASALIEYYERSVELGSPDDRIPEALETLADWLWNNMWVSDVSNGYGAFQYMTPSVEGKGSEAPAPDLNMLIAPMYGWLYQHTGDSRHLERGDAVFEGGVMLTDLGGAKRFNQNYRNSFKYVEWRAEGYARHGN